MGGLLPETADPFTVEEFFLLELEGEEAGVTDACEGGD